MLSTDKNPDFRLSTMIDLYGLTKGLFPDMGKQGNIKDPYKRR